MKCQRCGKAIKIEQGSGRPRKLCTTCSPPRLGRKPATVIPLHSEPVHPGRLERTVLAELSALGVEDTIDGAAALHAARSLDTVATTGAAQSSLLREMRASAEAARRLADAAGAVGEDGVDWGVG